MKVLHTIVGALRQGQTWNSWKPRFRWTGYEFEFDLHRPTPFGLHSWKIFELEKDEQKAYCIIVNPGNYDIKTIEEHLEKLNGPDSI